MGRHELLRDIHAATSPRFQDMLVAMSPAARASLLGQQSLLRGALVEELSEKFILYDHIPYSALGIFWCTQGGTIAEGKKLYAKCRSEYDSVVASGNQNKLHRVAHIIFNKSNDCRSQLDQWYDAAEVALDQYPCGFCTLQEYCLGSLVERRVEQIHAMVKKLGKGATFILAPYLCAKLREASHLQMLRKSSEFYELCVSSWRKRNLLDTILVTRKTAAELQRMSPKDKVDAIYQCSLEEEYKSTLAARTYQASWKKQLALDVPDQASLHDKACAAYWKTTLVTNGIYSLPRKLFDLAVNGLDESMRDQHSALEDVLAVVDGPMPETVPADDHVFFQVTNLHPERRYRVPLPHVEQKRHAVNVTVLDVVSTNPKNTFDKVVRNEGDIHMTLDMVWLSTSMDQAVNSCLRWVLKGQMTSWKLIAKEAALEDDLPPIDCFASSAIRVSSSATSDSRRLIVESLQRDVYSHSILKELMTRKAFGKAGHTPVRLDSLHCWRSETLSKLQELGVVVIGRDDIGEQLVSVNPDKLQFGMFCRIVEPLQHIRLSLHNIPPLRRSKLDILFSLHLDGWMPGENPQEIKTDSPKIYRHGLQQPISYFACLLEHKAVCAKGVSIQHGGLDAYYKCLLNLNSDVLQGVIENMANKQNAWFESKLKQLHVDKDEDDIQLALGDRDSSASTECVVAADLDLFDVDAPNSVATEVKRIGFSRQLVALHGSSSELKVYFDNFSASSGGDSDQRGFCNCSHHNCIRYRPVGCDSLEEYCAKAWLWYSRAGSFETKHEHLAFEPDAESVKEVVRSIRLKPF